MRDLVNEIKEAMVAAGMKPVGNIEITPMFT